MISFSTIFLLEARRVTVRVDRDELLRKLKVPPHSVPSHRVRIVPRGVYHEILHFFCSNLEDGVFGLETAVSWDAPRAACLLPQWAKSDKHLIPDSPYMQKKSRLAKGTTHRCRSHASWRLFRLFSSWVSAVRWKCLQKRCVRFRSASDVFWGISAQHSWHILACPRRPVIYLQNIPGIYVFPAYATCRTLFPWAHRLIRQWHQI